MNHVQTSHDQFFKCFRNNLHLKAGETYFAVQDSSKLDFTSQVEKEGLGYVSGLYQRGPWLHNTLVLSASGLPEGMLCQQVIIRQDADYGKKHQRKQRPFEEKESFKWARGLISGKEAADQYGCRFIHIMDRGADVLDVIRAAWREEQHFIIRSCQDRRLKGKDEEVKRLTRHLEQLAGAAVELELPDSRGKFQKQACQLKWQEFTVEGNKLSVIALKSLACPEIEWTLLTGQQVNSRQQALQVVQDYKRRWTIEELHKGLKTGCKVEKRQFSSLHATLNSIALLTLMAVWLLRLKVQAQAGGEEDIRPMLSPRQQQVLQLLAERYLRPLQKQKLTEFSAKWLAVLLANMGGFVGNQEVHLPGWQTLWLGYIRYKAFYEAFCQGVNAK